MSEDEQRRLGTDEQTDEVEAHRRTAGATDEGAAEGEDDDVEAHALRANRPPKTA